MSMICENCGEKLDDKANYCLICGEPVKHEKMVDPEDYQWSMSLKEVIDNEFDEAQNQTGISVESKSEKKKKERMMKLKNKADKKKRKDDAKYKKKSKLGMTLFIMIGILVIGVGGTIIGLSTGIIDASLVPFTVVNEIVPLHNLNVSMRLVEGVTNDGQPIGKEMSEYSVNATSFTVFGTVEDGEEGTPINVCWQDVTESIDMLDQVVYLDEKGEFYATIDVHAIGYGIKGITRPGDYAVTIVVDDKTDMSHEIPFKVSSGVFEAGEVDFINDMYMVNKIDAETFQAVEGYDENPDDILLEISYIAAPANTELIDKWYFEDDGWKLVEFVEPINYWVLTEETKSYMSDLPPFTPINGWKSGNYRVELYTKENQLAGATEFFIINSRPITQVEKVADSEGTNISEIYLEDKDGKLIVEAISSDMTELYCYYYLQGVTSKTKLTWVLGENDTGKELIHKTDIVNKDGKYLIEILSEDLEKDSEQNTYYISIYEGEYQTDAKQLANIVFDVKEDINQAITNVEQEGKVLTYEEERRLEWNDWLTEFVDSRLAEFYLTTELTQEQLIDFSVLRNFIGKNPDMLDSLDSFGMYWLSESDVNYTIDWLLDEGKIDKPMSTDLVYYDAGSYAIEQSKVETLPKRFAQMTKAYDASDNYYVLYFDVYEAPYDFNGDINGKEDDWTSANAQPEYLGEMMATYEEVTDPELGMRWVLHAFQWREKNE